MQHGFIGRFFAGLLICTLVTSAALANRAPIEPEPEPEPEPAVAYPLKVTTSKDAESQILLPKKLLAASDPTIDNSGFWLDAYVVRTIIAGLMLSAAAVVSLLLLRSRQTKLATACLMVGAVSLGVMSVSIADIPIGPPNRPVKEAAPKVTVKYVDGDTVTIIMGTEFPK